MKKNHDFGHCMSNAWRKTLRGMKLTAILFFLAIFTVAAEGFSQGTRISMKMENASLKEVFRELKSLSDLTFVYSEGMVANVKIDEINLQNVSVEEALNDCLEGTELEYYIENNVVVIRKKAPVVEQPIKQVKKEIKGKVTDDQGMPLPGVSVVIKGTNTGVATDIDGNYIIEMESNNAVLLFSFVGMNPQEIAYNGQSVINVKLTTDSEQMEEVVVVGYGTQKRERIGSAISEVKSEEIEMKSVGVTGFEQMLGGNIKGVQISQTSGAPGSSSVVRVRGITSPFVGGNNQPLYVIDGVPFNTDSNTGSGMFRGASQNPLENINTSDIESITVLKDAGATAIYGSRGANGVILITTKKGKKNSRMNVTFDTSWSISNPTNEFDLLDTKGFQQLHTMIAQNTLAAIAAGNTGLNASMANTIVDGDGNMRNTYSYNGVESPLWGDANTKWQDEIYNKNALVQKYSINVNGGNSKTSYSASISYMDQDALMKGEYMKRYNGRLNLDSDLTKWMKFGSSMTFTGGKNFVRRNTSSGHGTPSETIETRPDIAVYGDGGVLNRIPTRWQFNSLGATYFRLAASPVGSATNSNEVQSSTFFGNAYLEIKPIKDLKIRGSVSTSYFDTEGNNVLPKTTKLLDVFDPNSLRSSLNRSYNKSLTTTVSFQANYSKIFAEKHSVEAMTGVAWDRVRHENQFYYFSDLVDDDVLTNPQSGKFLESSGNKVVSGVNSAFTRLQYSYDGRYTLTVNMRTDESSKFGPGNKRGYFPSAAVNWNITEEGFMQSQDVIDNLKLRTSYGKTGSANVADYTYLKNFGIGSREDGLYMGEKAIIPFDVFPNLDVKWETTKELNLGVDFALFTNRLRGSVDWYRKNTSGALTPAPIFHEGGEISFTDNRAEISNQGMEFELGGDIIRGKDWIWTLSFNIAYNRNKIEDLNGGEVDDSYVVGEPIGTIKGYKVKKVIESQQEINDLNAASPTGFYNGANRGPGDYLYEDINADGRITVEDRVVLGSMQPDFFGGFTTAVQYKNLSLTAGFQYSVGNEKSWANYNTLIGRAGFLTNMGEDALSHTWRTDRTNAKYTRLVYGGPSNNDNDKTLQDASYLRLKVLNLNYNLPKSFLDKFGIANASVFLAGTNLLTFTKFKGLDPEGSGGSYSVGDTGHITDGAGSRDAYPFAKTYSAGIKVTF
jgi:TonB-linked SusC/RagA family outer membrane protein